MKKITFRSEDVAVDWLKPEPTQKHIPDWFKGINPIIDNEMTIKKCVPVLDAFTSGYVFRTSVDIFRIYSDTPGNQIRHQKKTPTPSSQQPPSY
jgi:hypothetical protein